MRLRHGEFSKAAWCPRLRSRFQYFSPEVYYETAVQQIVGEGRSWIDIGGGHARFLSNDNLAVLLSRSCRRLVAVDPSDNVHSNPYVQERVQAFLEDYRAAEPFDVATAHMVIEHVAKPEEFVASLARVLKPGGMAILLTVDNWAPITIVSRFTPFGFHVFVEKFLWKSKNKDTFPTVYKMNTQPDLRRLMGRRS